MAVEKSRLLLMLYVLTTSKGPVRAADMAAIAGVSERTIKNDMAELRNLAKASGAEIHSQKGEGYTIKILSADLFNPVNEQLQIRFNTMNYSKSELVNRTNDIVRRLIVAKNYLTFDDIADQLYLSRRTLQGQLKDVRQLLKSFNLMLQSRPKYGVKVIGGEFQRRLCMLELYEIHYYKAISLLNYDEYAQYFDVGEQDRNDFRHIFLHVLRSSGNAICDSYTNRIAWYLVLMRNRVRSGYPVMVDEAKKKLLRSLREYQIAGQVLQQLQEHFEGFQVPEEELMMLEVILLCWNDPVEDGTLEERYPQYAQKAVLMAQKIGKGIQERWNVDFMTLNDFFRVLRPCMIPLLFAETLDFHYQIIGSHVDSNGIRYSPVCEALARTAADIIEAELPMTLTEMDVNMLAVRFYTLLDQIVYPYRKRKLLICSRNGKMASEIIRNRLLKRFQPKWFESIDIVEFYEVRGLCQDDYDYLLLNFPSYAYRYAIPFMCINQIPDYRELNEVFNTVIMGGYQLQPLLDSFHWDTSSFYPDFVYDGKEAFIHLISYKNGRDVQSIQKMEQELKKFGDFRIVHTTAMIVQDRRYTKQNSFEIYHLQKPGIWEKKEIRYLVYITADFGNNLQRLRFVDQIAHCLVVNSQYLDDLMEKKDLNLLINYAKLCLQAGE